VLGTTPAARKRPEPVAKIRPPGYRTLSHSGHSAEPARQGLPAIHPSDLATALRLVQ